MTIVPHASFVGKLLLAITVLAVLGSCPDDGEAAASEATNAPLGVVETPLPRILPEFVRAENDTLDEGPTPIGRASETDSLRSRLRLPVSSDWTGPIPRPTRGYPSSTINTPTAYGLHLGQIFGGVGYQERIRYDEWTDGVLSFGVGLGNPVKYVGLDVSVNILDTYTEFAKDRSLSVKLHRQLPYRTAIAVGHENLWHTDGTDGGSSRYAVVSNVLILRNRPTAPFGSMVVNLGLGNERFLSEERFRQGDDGVNAFGSMAVRMARPVNAIANWTGQDLALGLSVAPIRTWPLVITPAVVDVTGQAGDGARFTVSAGLSYDFRR